MARRKLSTQGRIVAAGISVGVAGALVGSMAAGDHTAGASQSAVTSSDANGAFPSSSAGAAVPPSDDRGSRSTTGDFPQYAPQPQTSTGGS